MFWLFEVFVNSKQMIKYLTHLNLQRNLNLKSYQSQHYLYIGALATCEI